MRVIKRITTTILFSLTILVASGQGIFIKGKIQEIPENLVLNQILPQGTQTITKLSISPDGSFQHYVPEGNSGFYQLWVSKQSFTVLVLHPGDSVDLVLSSQDMSIPLSIKGSEDTEIARFIILQGRKLKQVRDSLQQVYTTFLYTPQRDSMTSVLMMQYSENDIRFHQLVRQTVQEHPGSLALYFFTEYLDKNTDIELFDLLLNSMWSQHSTNPFVQSLKYQVDISKITAIGNVAPDIKLPTPEGDSLSLSSFRGTYVLVDFWAGWCGPCRRENPKLRKVYQKYHDKGFQIYGVSLDKDRNLWLSAIAADSLAWSQVSDLKYWSSVAARAYGVSSIPASFLLDPEGRIIAKGIRSEQLEERLREIYKEE